MEKLEECINQDITRRGCIKLGVAGAIAVVTGCGKVHDPDDGQPSRPSGTYNGRADLYVHTNFPPGSQAYQWVIGALTIHLQEYERDWGLLVPTPRQWNTSSGSITPSTPLVIRTYDAEFLHSRFAEQAGVRGYWHRGEVRVALTRDLTAPDTYHYVLHHQLWASTTHPSGDHTHSDRRWTGLAGRLAGIRQLILRSR